MKLFILTLFVVIYSVSAKEIGVKNELKHFNGYKVLRASPITQSHLDILENLESQNVYDFWSDLILGQPADIMASPEQHKALQQILLDNKITFRVMIEDVEKLVEGERESMKRFNHGRMNWDTYQRMDTIYDWLIDIATANPGLCTLYSVGQSFEQRDLRVLRITNHTSTTPKKAFWIDGTIHAREWVATSTVTYIINEILTNQQAYADILEHVEFFIMPIVNPDGYEFSHTNNRMWRKTRTNWVGSCYGVDCNRNFGFGWGGAGSSNDPCDETYRGPAAWTEPEARAVQNFINTFRDMENTNWVSFATVHSYSQLWMTPWGYTFDLPEDYEELMVVADASVAALTAVHGTRYQTGSSANILYRSSGSSRDWAKGEGGFKYVYTLELRDTGDYGFILPPEQIIPTAEETWAGLQVLARHTMTA